jgi:hypothetical protein
MRSSNVECERPLQKFFLCAGQFFTVFAASKTLLLTHGGKVRSYNCHLLSSTNMYPYHYCEELSPVVCRLGDILYQSTIDDDNILLVRAYI